MDSQSVREAPQAFTVILKNKSQPSQYIILFNEIFVKQELPFCQPSDGDSQPLVWVSKMLWEGRKENITPRNTAPLAGLVGGDWREFVHRAAGIEPAVSNWVVRIIQNKIDNVEFFGGKR